MEIPEIRDDRTVVGVIDELKHRLKARSPESVIANELDAALNEIIKRHALGFSQHTYADLPVAAVSEVVVQQHEPNGRIVQFMGDQERWWRPSKKDWGAWTPRKTECRLYGALKDAR